MDEQFETKKKKVALTPELDEQFTGWDYNPEVEGKKTPRPLLTADYSNDEIINAPTVGNFGDSNPATMHWPETDVEEHGSESNGNKKENVQNGALQPNGNGNSQSSVSESSSSSSSESESVSEDPVENK